MRRIDTATAIASAGAIIVAQVILPAMLDLIGSILLAGICTYGGWKAAKASA